MDFFVEENLTTEDVQPELDGISENLLAVDGTIKNVTDMFGLIEDLNIGFNNVSARMYQKSATLVAQLLQAAN